MSVGFKYLCTHLAEALHVSAVQRYSHAAYRDGLDHDTITQLASIASWGRHPSNAERDLHRLVPSLYGPQFGEYSVGIEIFDADAGKVVFEEIPVLLPSDVLHRLWGKQSSKLWHVLTGATADKALEFWSNLERASPAFASCHPVYQHLAMHNDYI